MSQTEAASPAEAIVARVYGALGSAYAEDARQIRRGDAVAEAVELQTAGSDALMAAYHLAEVQLVAARGEILAGVRAGEISSKDGLRVLADLPTEMVPGAPPHEVGRESFARVHIVGDLLSANSDEPCVLIMPSGQTYVFPEHTEFLPGPDVDVPGMVVRYKDAVSPDTVIRMADLAHTVEGVVERAEVIAGLEDIGVFLRRDEVLQGVTINADSTGHNQVRNAIHLLGLFAGTDNTLSDFGFRPAEVERIQRLWVDLATLQSPLSRAVSLPELLQALPVVERHGADAIVSEAALSMDHRLFDALAAGGPPVIGYLERLVALHEADNDPAFEDGRAAVLRGAGRTALVAARTPDEV